MCGVPGLSGLPRTAHGTLCIDGDNGGSYMDTLLCEGHHRYDGTGSGLSDTTDDSTIYMRQSESESQDHLDPIAGL